MNCKRMRLAALALLTLLGGASARPEEAAAAAGASPDAALASCPHDIHRIATPEETVGRWYLLEILHAGEVPEADRNIRLDCLTYDIGIDGEHLTLSAYSLRDGTVHTTRNRTYSQVSPGRWETSEILPIIRFYAGKSSDNGNFLFLCGYIRLMAYEDVISSMALGRSPTVQEATLDTLRRENISVIQMRTDLIHCSASNSVH